MFPEGRSSLRWVTWLNRSPVCKGPWLHVCAFGTLPPQWHLLLRLTATHPSSFKASTWFMWAIHEGQCVNYRWCHDLTGCTFPEQGMGKANGWRGVAFEEPESWMKHVIREREGCFLCLGKMQSTALAQFQTKVRECMMGTVWYFSSVSSKKENKNSWGVNWGLCFLEEEIRVILGLSLKGKILSSSGNCSSL